MSKYIILMVLLLSGCNTTDKYYDRPAFNGIVVGVIVNLL